MPSELTFQGVTYHAPHWIVFSVVLAALLALDLFIHRGQRAESRRSAVVWSVVWIFAGLSFALFVWAVQGPLPAQQYVAAYLLEKSLSIDNLFVFLIIFQSLAIPRALHRTVLSWGIFGALLFRLVFIFLGISAIERFAWVTWVFAAILLWAAYQAFRGSPTEERENKVVVYLSKRLPLTPHVAGKHFFVREQGKLMATPLFVAVCAVELTDIAFAVDSVPAALSVSHDRFIVYSSNAFAILGLRALYIVLANTLSNMKYLHYGLSVVLAFAAVKLITAEWFEIPAWLSIACIVLTIGAAAFASVRAQRRAAGAPMVKTGGPDAGHQQPA